MTHVTIKDDKTSKTGLGVSFNHKTRWLKYSVKTSVSIQPFFVTPYKPFGPPVIHSLYKFFPANKINGGKFSPGADIVASTVNCSFPDPGAIVTGLLIPLLQIIYLFIGLVQNPLSSQFSIWADLFIMSHFSNVALSNENQASITVLLQAKALVNVKSSGVLIDISFCQRFKKLQNH